MKNVIMKYGVYIISLMCLLLNLFFDFNSISYLIGNIVITELVVLMCTSSIKANETNKKTNFLAITWSILYFIFALIMINKLNTVIFIIETIMCLSFAFIATHSLNIKYNSILVSIIGISSLLYGICAYYLYVKYFYTASSLVLLVTEILLVFIYLVLIVLCLVYFSSKIELEVFVVISILCVGLLYIFILPPFTAPDEDYHFAMTYSYSNALLGGERYIRIDPNRSDGDYYLIPCRETDAQCFADNYKSRESFLEPSQSDYLNFARSSFQFVGWQNQFSNSFYGKLIGNYSFQIYLPAILGITFSRIVGLGGMTLLYVGRIANLVFYALMSYIAIKKIPFGKKTLALIASFPMSLHLASSYSYDSILLAASFVFIGYTLSLITRDRIITKKEILVIIISAILVSSVKVVYTALVILLLLIPKERFNKTYYKYIFCFVTFGISLLVAFWGKLNFYDIIDNSGSTIRLYTISYALRNITHTIIIYLKTLKTNLIYFINGMFGNYLGWLNIAVSHKIIELFTAIFLLSLPLSKDEPYPDTKHGLIYFIFGMSMALVLVASTILWNSVNTDLFYGFQGRYWLEILPLIAVGLISKYNPLVYKCDISKSIFAISIPLHMIVLLQVYTLIMMR